MPVLVQSTRNERQAALVKKVIDEAPKTQDDIVIVYTSADFLDAAKEASKEQRNEEQQKPEQHKEAPQAEKKK